jgi:hypothetical protein
VRVVSVCVVLCNSKKDLFSNDCILCEIFFSKYRIALFMGLRECCPESIITFFGLCHAQNNRS